MKIKNQIIANNPARKGELAAPKTLFGPRNCYAVAPVYTRHDCIAWFVWDAETPDRYGNYDPVMGWEPAVIRITESLDLALANLV